MNAIQLAAWLTAHADGVHEWRLVDRDDPKFELPLQYWAANAQADLEQLGEQILARVEADLRDFPDSSHVYVIVACDERGKQITHKAIPTGQRSALATTERGDAPSSAVSMVTQGLRHIQVREREIADEQRTVREEYLAIIREQRLTIEQLSKTHGETLTARDTKIASLEARELSVSSMLFELMKSRATQEIEVEREKFSTEAKRFAMERLGTLFPLFISKIFGSPVLGKGPEAEALKTLVLSLDEDQLAAIGAALKPHQIASFMSMVEEVHTKAEDDEKKKNPAAEAAAAPA
jgi:hypothetical protein